LLALSEFLKIFGTTYLGKSSDCLNMDEWDILEKSFSGTDKY
jgi:hypothetical protein